MKQSLKAMCVAVLACSVFSASVYAAPIKGSPMETAKLTMVNEWDKVFCPKRQSNAQKSYFCKSLRHHACGRYVCS